MSCFICRQCARRPLRIPQRIPALPPRPAIPPLTLSSSGTKHRSLSTHVSSSFTTASPAPSNTAGTLANSNLRSNASVTKIPKSIPTSNPNISSKITIPFKGPTKRQTKSSKIRVQKIQRRIDQMAYDLDADAIYLQFWKICQTRTIEEQCQIWGGASYRDYRYPITPPSGNSMGNFDRLATTRQESLYRAFNSSVEPLLSSPPTGEPDVLRIRCDRPALDSDVGSDVQLIPSMFTLHFLGQSHSKRLLQMHRYFEEFLKIPIGYYARIALLVAFSNRGDMVTTLNLFRKWQRSSPVLRNPQNQNERAMAGKEMYSAVIRGLVGKNSQDSELQPFYGKGAAIGARNRGVTQVYTALELFYDFLRQGGIPTYETYHSLVIGLSTFKNDMEAAELLLDHMIIKKKRPYAQVLHVMCREYARRKDFVSAERIFGMLKEYGIRPRAITCNIMLQAIFQMPIPDALQYLSHIDIPPQNNSVFPQGSYSQDSEMVVEEWKRQKVRHLREYMHDNGTAPDDYTFSILSYGFGHMKSGLPDLQEVMIEMLQSPTVAEPNLVILNSLLFAHLNHDKFKKAESILDQILQSLPPLKNLYADYSSSPISRQQESPFWKRASKGSKGEEITLQDADIIVHSPRMPTIYLKGAFHALMLAYAEQGDISSMERIVDKMIQTQNQQQEQYSQLRQTLSNSESTFSSSESRSQYLALRPIIELEADEYTATIMLIGYLTSRDFAKAELIQQQIQARQDWRSSPLFQDRYQSRQDLIDFVRQQNIKEVSRQSSQEIEYNHDSTADNDNKQLMHLTSSTSTTATTTTTTTTSELKPFSGNVQGELDDDFEIDVTTLSAKLRGLMNSSPSTSSSSPSSTSSPSPSSSSSTTT
ncbi:hypothetical protein FBU30_011075 [Linnemannia zychae]|nr:hypothetical protein FBU30_011075 [Linnemannia zychae]